MRCRRSVGILPPTRNKGEASLYPQGHLLFTMVNDKRLIGQKEKHMLAVLTIIAGIVLLIGSLAGSRAGSPSERGLMAAVGAGSIAYSVWVMHQSSGIYFFSVLPMGWAIVVAVRVALGSRESRTTRNQGRNR